MLSDMAGGGTTTVVPPLLPAQPAEPNKNATLKPQIAIRQGKPLSPFTVPSYSLLHRGYMGEPRR